MRLKSARLHGLMGVYSPSGKKEIFIDFTKCKNNIILIIGQNGSGKTTIWEALQPIPLPPYKFMEKEPGFVELEYIHEDVIYIIRIEYPITNSRERAQTKAFIRKILSDGDIIELNPNGNISSYKSALFNEFNLDPNFVSLSQLSNEDMGIVNRKPSDRKKFVASIVESIEVYNNIQKAATKRSSIYRSLINSITAKIDTIGNEENLQTQLTALENRLQRLNAERAKLLKDLALSESTITIIDPNSEIQNIFRKVSDDLYSIEQQLKGYDIYIQKISNSFGTTSLDELSKMYKLLSDESYKLQVNINNSNDTIQTLLLSKEEETKYIQMKTARVQSLQSEYNFEYIQERIKTVIKLIGECEMIFSRLNIPKDNQITKEEFIHGVGIMTEIKDAISAVKSFCDEVTLETALNNIKNGISKIQEYHQHLSALEEASRIKQTIEGEIKVYNNFLSYTSDLDKRPSNCSIDECPFIKTALEYHKKKPMENLERLQGELEQVLLDIQFESEKIKELEQLVKIEQMINNIIRNIRSSSSILNKFPTGQYLTDTQAFLDNFTNVIMLNKLTELEDSLCYANVFEQNKSYNAELVKLEGNKKAYENKIELIEILNDEIQELNNKLNNIIKELEDLRNSIQTQSQSKLEIDSKIKSLENAIKIIKDMESLQEKQDSLLGRIQTLTNQMDSINVEINKQNTINSYLANVDKDISPLSAERDKLIFSLKQLKEYNEELFVYNQKYSIIELIKKYSSPTKGGIQTLFMQLYMGKTISMANELLSLLFNGRFELLPYIINDSEFKIPCVNKESSVVHDDISSCSSAERAMISMMISFSLLHHSSTVYNILRLDEIDGALDQNNRSKFLDVLDKFMRELGVENCIMISHSSEMDMSNVDIIQLTPVDNSTPNGNIIFTYND